VIHQPCLYLYSNPVHPVNPVYYKYAALKCDRLQFRSVIRRTAKIQDISEPVKGVAAKSWAGVGVPGRWCLGGEYFLRGLAVFA
jgi:hypothetical protein